MEIRFDDIGNRLKAFRLGLGLSVEELAERAGLSRAALYRYERGEIAKVETLGRLAAALQVSLPNLLGVGAEYITSAVSFFERMRQLEAAAGHIVVLFGPVSYLLTSESYDATLAEVLKESLPPEIERREEEIGRIDELMEILRARKRQYAARRPSVVSLVSASEMERFLRNGLVGRSDLAEPTVRERRAQARTEAEGIARLMEEQPLGVQVGLLVDTIPNTSFQVFRQSDRAVLAISPFRLGEQPNVRVGVAMITSAPEPLRLHEEIASELWRRARKGPEAGAHLRRLIARSGV